MSSFLHSGEIVSLSKEAIHDKSGEPIAKGTKGTVRSMFFDNGAKKLVYFIELNVNPIVTQSFYAHELEVIE